MNGMLRILLCLCVLPVGIMGNSLPDTSKGRLPPWYRFLLLSPKERLKLQQPRFNTPTETEAEIAGYDGVYRKIRPLKYEDDGALNSPANQENPRYAYLALAKIPDRRGVKSIERYAGIRFAGFVRGDPNRTYAVYVVALNGQSLAQIKKKFKARFRDYVINVEPIRVEDKITPKIQGKKTLAVGERNSRGEVHAYVWFYGGTAESIADSLLRTHRVNVRFRDGAAYRVNASVKSLQSLAKSKYVQNIAEYDTIFRPAMDAARVHTKVDAIQSVDTSVFPPNQVWMADSEHTGKGIWVGIYDGGDIDTTRPDFKEYGIGGGDSVFRRAPPQAWPIIGCCSGDSRHATLVASVAAGNGMRSEFAGGSRYQWRGVAFKSLLISGYSSNHLGDGDVNNHSHTLSTIYNGNDVGVDNSLHNHASYNHVVVYAAANNGIYGYYSMGVHSKNAIVVGATLKETDLYAGFASQGPTFDGRTKPDIVAPGGSEAFPSKYPTPLKVYIDSLVIRNSVTPRRIAWNFNSDHDSEGWSGSFQADNLDVDNGALHFYSHFPTSWLQLTGSPIFTSNIFDTLVIRHKLVHPDIPIKLSHLEFGISWNSFSDPPALSFFLPAPDTDWHETKIALRDLWGKNDGTSPSAKTHNWSDGTAINSLWLFIQSDSVIGIRSVASSSVSTLGDYGYSQGTSEAAPQVTGIAALMLQAYAENYCCHLDDIHSKAPWNSTIKAILIHTATDLVKRLPTWTEEQAALNVASIGVPGWLNPDLAQFDTMNAYSRYFPGPDYSTGYGLVNAQRAVAYVDTNRFKQDSITQNQTVTYSITVPPSSDSLRATLAWDDTAGAVTYSTDGALVNDLDMVLVSPSGGVYYPWALNPLPHNTGANPGIDPIHASDVDSAYQGINYRDNVEVVDVPHDSIVSGVWKVVVHGTNIPSGPQDFSLVSDFKLRKKIHSIGWLLGPGPCPESYGLALLNDEQTDNQTQDSVRTGSSGAWSQYDELGGITRFSEDGVNFTTVWGCRESIDTLPIIANDYAVLQLSPVCPVNGASFARYSDNENTSNTNSWAGGGFFGPSWQTNQFSDSLTDGRTQMYFCYVKGDGSITDDPPWKSRGHGALANITDTIYGGISQRHWHIQDDENDGNLNQYIWTPETEPDSTRIKNNLFNGSESDTHYFWDVFP